MRDISRYCMVGKRIPAADLTLYLHSPLLTDAKLADSVLNQEIEEARWFAARSR